jgi:predicted amidohydrolase
MRFLSFNACPQRMISGLGLISFAVIFQLASVPFSLSGQSGSKDTGEVKVAAVQVSGHYKTPTPELKKDPVETAIKYIHRAGRDSAQLVVFPEYYLGRISIPGEATKALSKAVAQNQIYAIIGGWEVFDDGTFANVAILFERDGSIAGKYYKTHAAVDSYCESEPAYSTPPEGHDKDWFIQNDPEWIMKRGASFPVFDLDFGKIGIFICYDGWFPEPPRILSLKGAEILVWMNGRGGPVEDFIVKTIMFQNCVSMICTNQAKGWGTMIAEYPATIKQYCDESREAYITGKINLKRLRLARRDNRNFQQRRPGIYQELLKHHPVWENDQNPGE